MIKLQFQPGTDMAGTMTETVSYVSRARAFAGLALYDALYCWALDSAAVVQAKQVSDQRGSGPDVPRRRKGVDG